MLKIIGSLMVLTATAIMGINSAALLSVRVKSLSSLVAALEILKTEICERLTPLPELLEAMPSQCERPVSLFFKNCADYLLQLAGRPFSAAWRNAAENTPELLLRDDERQALTDMGRFLGRYDAEDQRRAIEMAQKRLENFLRRAESERLGQSRVRTVLGVSAGITIVLILI